MYSMVLMAALTTGVDVPDFGRRGGGCCGCYGGCWGGCYGGCWGGCYGGGYARGGWGGGYGGWGGGYGGWGGGYGGWGGGWGGWGYVAAPVISSYASPMIAASTAYADPALSRSMYYNPSAAANERATIIVHLPAKARLIVDGKPTNSTSATRRFVSPPLAAGQSYHYVFKAEMDRDGEKVTTTQRVNIRAGKTENVYLKIADLDQPAEREPSPVTPVERKGLPAQRKGVPN